MLKQAQLIEGVAAYKKDSNKLFWSAVSSLLALAWPYKREKFAFDDTFPLYEDAIDICLDLSDQCVEKAWNRTSGLINERFDDIDDGEVWLYAFDEEAQKSFDMAGSHLLELLAVWISVAVINEWTESYTKVMITRYITNPFLCPEWRGIPLDTLSWGRGYAKDIPEQLAIIGQGLIVKAARKAQQTEAENEGYDYYVRRRGSDFECDICDSMANIPIPIYIPFDIPHPRCVCFPEYFNE